MITVGVVGVQGDVSEHVAAMEKAMAKREINGNVVVIKTPRQIRKTDALALPGGESTTIGKLLAKTGLDSEIKKMASEGKPILGTCAGLVLLSKEGDSQVARTGQPLLGLMDAKVNRNAFGRQRESFEVDLKIPVLGKEKFHCIFIRAPAIERVWDSVKVLAEYGDTIVLARQDNLIAAAFHPELGSDTRLHEYFLNLL